MTWPADTYAPILDVVVASAGDAPRDFCELVVVLGVQLHDQRILFRRPDFVLFDRRVDVIVVALTTLLSRSPWHHLRDLGPAATHTEHTHAPTDRQDMISTGHRNRSWSRLSSWHAPPIVIHVQYLNRALVGFVFLPTSTLLLQ